MLVKASNYSLSSHPSIRLIHHRLATLIMSFEIMRFMFRNSVKRYIHTTFLQYLNECIYVKAFESYSQPSKVFPSERLQTVVYCKPYSSLHDNTLESILQSKVSFGK